MEELEAVVEEGPGDGDIVVHGPITEMVAGDAAAAC